MSLVAIPVLRNSRAKGPGVDVELLSHGRQGVAVAVSDCCLGDEGVGHVPDPATICAHVRARIAARPLSAERHSSGESGVVGLRQCVSTDPSAIHDLEHARNPVRFTRSGVKGGSRVAFQICFSGLCRGRDAPFVGAQPLVHMLVAGRSRFGIDPPKALHGERELHGQVSNRG